MERLCRCVEQLGELAAAGPQKSDRMQMNRQTYDRQSEHRLGNTYSNKRSFVHEFDTAAPRASLCQHCHYVRKQPGWSRCCNHIARCAESTFDDESRVGAQCLGNLNNHCCSAYVIQDAPRAAVRWSAQPWAPDSAHRSWAGWMVRERDKLARRGDTQWVPPTFGVHRTPGTDRTPEHLKLV
jgi:hypothetical protein